MRFCNSDPDEERSKEAGQPSVLSGIAPCDEVGGKTVDVLNLMATLSEDVPELAVGRSVLALAKFLSVHQHALTDEQAATILALGAGLWRRSIVLDDCAGEIGLISATRQ